MLTDDQRRLPTAVSPALAVVEPAVPSTSGPHVRCACYVFCSACRRRMYSDVGIDPRYQLRRGEEVVLLQLTVSEYPLTGEGAVCVHLSLCPASLHRTPMRHLHHRIPSGTATGCCSFCAPFLPEACPFADVGLEDMAASLSKARAGGSDRRSVLSSVIAVDSAGASR